MTDETPQWDLTKEPFTTYHYPFKDKDNERKHLSLEIPRTMHTALVQLAGSKAVPYGGNVNMALRRYIALGLYIDSQRLQDGELLELLNEVVTDEALKAVKERDKAQASRMDLAKELLRSDQLTTRGKGAKILREFVLAHDGDYAEEAKKLLDQYGIK